MTLRRRQIINNVGVSLAALPFSPYMLTLTRPTGPRPFVREGARNHFLRVKGGSYTPLNIEVYIIVAYDPSMSSAPAIITSDIRSMLQEANKVFGEAGIIFTFAPADIEYISSVELISDSQAAFPARRARALLHPGKLVLICRQADGGFSDINQRFVCMPIWPGQLNWGRELAHECGHYFGLSHTFAIDFSVANSGLAQAQWDALSLPDREKVIRKWQKDNLSLWVAGGGSITDALNVFDGDLPLVNDTPPDDGGQLISVLNGLDSCGPISTVTIPSPFAGQADYTLRPDRSNVMSYFHKCPNIQPTLSGDQVNVVRASIENGVHVDLVDGKLSTDPDVIFRFTPAVVSWGSGRLDLFARGSDARLYNKVWEASTGTWWPEQTGWSDLGGSFTGSPAAVTWGPGRLDVFAVGKDGRLYNKIWETSRNTWWPEQTGWSDLGGSFTGSPAAVTWGPGRLDVFAVGKDGRLYNKIWETSRNTWWPEQTGWSDLGSPNDLLNGDDTIISATAVAAKDEPGRIDVFGRTFHGHVYNKVREASGNGWWPGQTDWQDLGGAIVGTPALSKWGAGRLDLFVRWMDGSVRSKNWSSGSAWWPSQMDWSVVGVPS